MSYDQRCLQDLVALQECAFLMGLSLRTEPQLDLDVATEHSGELQWISLGTHGEYCQCQRRRSR